MTLPMISAYTAAILGIFQIMLMIPAANSRRKFRVLIGDGNNEDLLYKIRRHGNFTENAPIFLILLAFLEIAGAAPNLVIALAITFIVTRLSHAYALSGPGKPLASRLIGAMGTVLTILTTSGLLLWQLSQLP